MYFKYRNLSLILVNYIVNSPNHPNPSPRLKSKYIPIEAMLIKNGDEIGGNKKAMARCLGTLM